MIKRFFCVIALVTMLGICLASAAAIAAEQQAASPILPIRELYAPAHFGNSYEAMGENEMRKVLSEAVWWGFNGYNDWFDPQDCNDPFPAPGSSSASRRCIGVDLPNARWQRKKANFCSAQALGMRCSLTITPNHVYLDQCRPELAAIEYDRMYGQTICPSKPEARSIILRNSERLLADLARSGVRLKGVAFAPYDCGGCACENCKPWIVTFGKLAREIHAIALRYHPDVEMNLIGWWWTEEEHRQFADWADREAPGLAKNLFLHILYDSTKPADVRLPKGCRRGAFVHIGYADQNNPEDNYGFTGPVIAPARIPKTLRSLATNGDVGFMAYSEGVFEDVNKALVAGLASGKFRTADEVLNAYARRYFGADAKTAPKWAAWLKQWGLPFAVDTTKAGAELALLREQSGPAAWQRKQWELKLELFRLHGAIMADGEQWTSQRLALVDQFWATQEHIHRDIWGLGLMTYALNRSRTGLPWYPSWAQHVAAPVGPRGKEQ